MRKASEMFDVGEAVGSLARVTGVDPDLPSPASVWWRSQVLRRRSRRRGLRAVAGFDLGAKLVALGAACTGILLAWPRVSGLFGRMAVWHGRDAAEAGTDLLCGAAFVIGALFTLSLLAFGGVWPRIEEIE